VPVVRVVIIATVTSLAGRVDHFHLRRVVRSTSDPDHRPALLITLIVAGDRAVAPQPITLR